MRDLILKMGITKGCQLPYRLEGSWASEPIQFWRDYSSHRWVFCSLGGRGGGFIWATLTLIVLFKSRNGSRWFISGPSNPTQHLELMIIFILQVFFSLFIQRLLSPDAIGPGDRRAPF